MNLALFGGRGQVEIRQRRRVLLAPFLRKREDDHGQERFLLQIAHQVNVQRLILIGSRGGPTAGRCSASRYLSSSSSRWSAPARR